MMDRYCLLYAVQVEVFLLLVNLFEGQIRPEDLLGGDVHVQCNYILLARDDLGIFALIQSHLSHLMSVGEKQVGNGS